MKIILIALMVLTLSGCGKSTATLMIEAMVEVKKNCQGKVGVKLYINSVFESIEFTCDDLNRESKFK